MTSATVAVPVQVVPFPPGASLTAPSAAEDTVRFFDPAGAVTVTLMASPGFTGEEGTVTDAPAAGVLVEGEGDGVPAAKAVLAAPPPTASAEARAMDERVRTVRALRMGSPPERAAGVFPAHQT
ncbi:hypothetical protein [Streptomyces katrae]|uniref:Uncharacterized protein n=1 Tax=Streptomyces katrae TaxID=68223 RepID=A0A0F4JEM2_9ACTN|nr:hypothetical protein [Streptomyces katrae]KJY32645.1 hypothetical protein VR44_15495 [Streptomyces katrae]